MYLACMSVCSRIAQLKMLVRINCARRTLLQSSSDLCLLLKMNREEHFFLSLIKQSTNPLASYKAPNLLDTIELIYDGI